VEERVVLHQESCELSLKGLEVEGKSGEKLIITEKVNEVKLKQDLKVCSATSFV
jgi:hypothetical protein